jgi:hypothetical protein
MCNKNLLHWTFSFFLYLKLNDSDRNILNIFLQNFFCYVDVIDNADKHLCTYLVDVIRDTYSKFPCIQLVNFFNYVKRKHFGGKIRFQHILRWNMRAPHTAGLQMLGIESGWPDWANFAFWAIVFMRKFCENYRSSPNLSATFSHGKGCIVILTKMGWPTFWAIFLQTHGHPGLSVASRVLNGRVHFQPRSGRGRWMRADEWFAAPHNHICKYLKCLLIVCKKLMNLKSDLSVQITFTKFIISWSTIRLYVRWSTLCK